MLANPQFVSLYSEIVDDPTDKKVALIERFGGLVISLDPGTYRIDRDPYKFSILVHAEGGDPKESSAGSVAGTVFINTFKKHVDCSLLSRAFINKAGFDAYVKSHGISDAKALTLDELSEAVAKPAE
jgi:hypothetical protein